ncbi:MAG: VTT domain-containing protein [Simkaniaceae bacterium]
MIQSLKEIILQHQNYAPYAVFFALLLAGLNIPISIDVILVISAFFAATTIKEHSISIYFSLLLGTYFSAWASYWIGRFLGEKLLKVPLFSSLFPQRKLQKMKIFYEKYGLWTLLIGRFVPFGVRNCLFMSTGLSRSHFGKFIARDALACFLWVSFMYAIFFHLSRNLDTLLNFLKKFQIGLFLGFSVTVIVVIWYKIKKKRNRREYP